MSFAKKPRRVLMIPAVFAATVVAGSVATLGACGGTIVATGGGKTTASSSSAGTGGLGGAGGDGVGATGVMG
jgi:hypothetical protein